MRTAAAGNNEDNGRLVTARDPHVRFDERAMETEHRQGHSGTGNRKGRSTRYALPSATAPPLDSTRNRPSDYDTISTVTLDGSGNVTVDNSLCEGIDSAGLPAEPPQFP